MGTQPQYWIIMEYNISWEYIHYTVMVLFPLHVSWYINMFLECIMAIVCNEQFSSNKMATCRMIWWKNIPWQTLAGWMRDFTNHGSIRMSSILRIWHNGNMMGFIRRIFMGYHQTHREIFGGIFLMWMSTQIYRHGYDEVPHLRSSMDHGLVHEPKMYLDPLYPKKTTWVNFQKRDLPDKIEAKLVAGNKTSYIIMLSR